MLKQQGQAVAEDETIAQIETDKVTVDIRAPKAGVLATVDVSGCCMEGGWGWSAHKCRLREACSLHRPALSC